MLLTDIHSLVAHQNPDSPLPNNSESYFLLMYLNLQQQSLHVVLGSKMCSSPL